MWPSTAESLYSTKKVLNNSAGKNFARICFSHFFLFTESLPSSIKRFTTLLNFKKKHIKRAAKLRIIKSLLNSILKNAARQLLKEASSHCSSRRFRWLDCLQKFEYDAGGLFSSSSSFLSSLQRSWSSKRRPRRLRRWCVVFANFYFHCLYQLKTGGRTMVGIFCVCFY